MNVNFNIEVGYLRSQGLIPLGALCYVKFGPFNEILFDPATFL